MQSRMCSHKLEHIFRIFIQIPIPLRPKLLYFLCYVSMGCSLERLDYFQYKNHLFMYIDKTVMAFKNGQWSQSRCNYLTEIPSKAHFDQLYYRTKDFFIWIILRKNTALMPGQIRFPTISLSCEISCKIMDTTFTKVLNINLQAPVKFEYPFFHSPKWDNPYFVAWWLYNDKGFWFAELFGCFSHCQFGTRPMNHWLCSHLSLIHWSLWDLAVISHVQLFSGYWFLMPQDPIDDKSILVLAMVWYRQATNHYLNRCWMKSKALMASHKIQRPLNIWYIIIY